MRCIDKKGGIDNYILLTAEGAALIAEVNALKASRDIPVTVSAYAKHAIMSHARLRRLEAAIRDTVRELKSAEHDTVSAAGYAAQLRGILEAS